MQPGVVHGLSSLAGNGGHLLVGPPPWWQLVERRRPRICIGFGAWPIGQVEPETTIMIYDAKISWDGGAVLYMDELTKGVLIPLKEACSGIGCMRMGATFLGLRCISSMGINPKVIGHLRLGNSDGKQLQRHIGCADVLHSPHHDLRATLPLHLRNNCFAASAAAV